MAFYSWGDADYETFANAVRRAPIPAVAVRGEDLVGAFLRLAFASLKLSRRTPVCGPGCHLASGIASDSLGAGPSKNSDRPHAPRRPATLAREAARCATGEVFPPSQ